MGLAMTLFAGVAMLMLARLRAVAGPAWRAAREASADLFGFVEERLAGLVDVRANGATSYVMPEARAGAAGAICGRGRGAWRAGRSGLGCHLGLLFALGTALGLGAGRLALRGAARSPSAPST